MTAIPPFVILLDLSALMIDNPRSWQEFSGVGQCFVPKAVVDEVQVLSNHASEPAIERTAREFVRFFPTSGWSPTSSIATHPALQPAAGHELSKKARLSLAVAQTAYGLSQNRPDALVVVVANDQGLIQRLRTLKIPNLCGVPVAALVQWHRTQRKPPVVLNQLQLMRSTVGATATPATVAARVVSPPSMRTAEPKRTATQRSTKRLFRPVFVFYNLLTLLIVAIAGLTAWRFIHPPSFAKFWQQLPFDQLPDLQINPVKK